MNRQEHPLWEEELMAFAEGQLDSEKTARVALHLETCSECAIAVADAKQVSLQMAKWEVEDAPDRLTQKILAQLHLQAPERKNLGLYLRPSWWTRSRAWTYGLGGAIAAIMLLVFATTPSLLRSRQANTDVAETQIYRDRSTVADKREQANRGQGQQGQGQIVELFSKQSASRQYERGEGSLGKLIQEPQAAATPSGPMIIKSVQLTMMTRDFAAARSGIEAIVRQNQGYIDQLTVQGETGSAHSLSATLRIPSNRFDAGLNDLRKIGQVRQESQNNSEVTSQYVDLSARLNNARNTEQRLVAMLRERTGKLSDVVEAEREISRVREQIEQMDAERKNLTNQVQYATIHIDLAEEYHAQIEPSLPGTGTRLRNAVVEGYTSAVESAIGLALAVLLYGPSLLLWMVFLAPFVAAFWLLRRRLAAK